MVLLNIGPGISDVPMVPRGRRIGLFLFGATCFCDPEGLAIDALVSLTALDRSFTSRKGKINDTRSIVVWIVCCLKTKHRAHLKHRFRRVVPRSLMVPIELTST